MQAQDNYSLSGYRAKVIVEYGAIKAWPTWDIIYNDMDCINTLSYVYIYVSDFSVSAI